MHRILVVLPNWYGETLFATPFLRALRRARPEAFVATLGWPQCREVLLHTTCANELLDYEEHARHRGLSGAWRLIGELRARRFDTAFILRKSFSRTLWLMLAGIPDRIGFDNAKSGWLLTRRVAPDAAPRHKALTYLPLLTSSGINASAGLYEYVVDPQEREAARALLAEHDLLGEGPLVILHPGANWFHKRWAPERFAALGDRLTAAHRARIAITGGPDDVPLAQSVARSMRTPGVVFAGCTTLRGLAACLAQARLMVSNDTGILHIAAALRTPIVALYGPTSPALTGPLGDPQRLAVIHHAECCPAVPCYQPDHPPHAGMASITVDEVYEAAVALLDRRQET